MLSGIAIAPSKHEADQFGRLLNGRVTWIHTVHGSSLAQSNINAWLDGGNTAQGLKQSAAVEAAKHVVSRRLIATSLSEIADAAIRPQNRPAKPVEPTQPKAAAPARACPPARLDPISSLGPSQSPCCPRFERLSRDDELFVAHRYEDGLYRMANPALGAKKHHAANQIAVYIGAVAGYLKRGTFSACGARPQTKSISSRLLR
jgi:hypothetical protein